MHDAEDVTVAVTVIIHEAGQSSCLSCRRLRNTGLASEKAEIASTIVPARAKVKPIAVVLELKTRK